MSTTNIISDLIKCFISRFGYAAVPPTQELTLKNFSEIPDLVQKLRTLKYGPKIKIADGQLGVVTTKYMAGYSGTPPYGYSESIFMEFGSKITSHQKIREEMVNLRELHPTDSLICTLQEKAINECCIACNEQGSQIVDRYTADCLEEVSPPPWITSEKEVEAFKYKVIQKMAPTIKTWENYAGRILKDKLEGFMQTEESECERLC